MELNVTISALALLIVALASIGGGLVLYRGSRRVCWRAVGMSAVALGVGVLLVVALTLPVSTEGEAPEPVVLMDLVPAQPTDAPTTLQEPNAPVSSTMLVPRPENIEVLVRMSHIIVLGTISAVLDEKLIGAYGEDGNPYIPVEESGSPYTDYEVRVESVLKNDGDVEDGGVLVLRMVGHLSQQSYVVTLAAVQLPQPGSHYLLALGRNPDGTYGSGNEGLIYVDGEKVAYADGVAFSTELTGNEFVEAVRQKADGNDPLAPSLTHGSPPPPAPSGAPLASLKFRDVNYVASGGTRRPSGEGADIVFSGTEFNVDDLELVVQHH